MAQQPHHPWRSIRDLGDEWDVQWTANLPDGTHAVTSWSDRTLWFADDLTQVERRCAAEHERQHILRGPGGDADAEELAVEIATAHALITLDDLLDKGKWASHRDELAQELNVTRDVLDTRLAHLHPSERAYIKRAVESWT